MFYINAGRHTTFTAVAGLNCPYRRLRHILFNAIEGTFCASYTKPIELPKQARRSTPIVPAPRVGSGPLDDRVVYFRFAPLINCDTSFRNCSRQANDIIAVGYLKRPLAS